MRNYGDDGSIKIAVFDADDQDGANLSGHAEIKQPHLTSSWTHSRLDPRTRT